MWERRLREIERQTYSAKEFIDGLKQMVNEITLHVLRDNSDRKIGKAEEPQKGKKRTKK